MIRVSGVRVPPPACEASALRHCPRPTDTRNAFRVPPLRIRNLAALRGAGRGALTVMSPGLSPRQHAREPSAWNCPGLGNHEDEGDPGEVPRNRHGYGHGCRHEWPPLQRSPHHAPRRVANAATSDPRGVLQACATTLSPLGPSRASAGGPTPAARSKRSVQIVRGQPNTFSKVFGTIDLCANRTKSSPFEVVRPERRSTTGFACRSRSYASAWVGFPPRSRPRASGGASGSRKRITRPRSRATRWSSSRSSCSSPKAERSATRSSASTSKSAATPPPPTGSTGTRSNQANGPKAISCRSPKCATSIPWR